MVIPFKARWKNLKKAQREFPFYPTNKITPTSIKKQPNSSNFNKIKRRKSLRNIPYDHLINSNLFIIKRI